MVASEATKTEISDTIDTMIEEVSLFFLEQTCPLFYDNGIVQPEKKYLLNLVSFHPSFHITYIIKDIGNIMIRLFY